MIAPKNIFCKAFGHKYEKFHMAPGKEEKNYLTRCQRCKCRLLVKTLWFPFENMRKIVDVVEQQPTPRKK